MLETKVRRRDVLVGLALAGCGVRATAPPARSAADETSNTNALTAPLTGEGTAMEPKALSSENVVKPIPFDPAKLNGISERMIRSHHENNYAGAVKNLNRTEQELAAITKETPPFVVSALRERELTYRGSKLLHEQYFGNLGGDGKRAGEIERALAAAYGSADRWEEHFRATGAGLGGGSGWVILGYELDSGGLRTLSAGNHTQSLALFVPLLVMDMYEHSYQMDYGAAAPKYIDAFFANLRWDVVEHRLLTARKVRALMAA